MNNNLNFNLSSYHFDLPDELIAHEPLAQRDGGRLLVVHRQSKRVEHRLIRDLPMILDKNFVVVSNNTKVFRARLIGERLIEENPNPGGKVEFFMLQSCSEDGKTWQGLMKSSANIVPGFKFKVKHLVGEVIKREETRVGLVYQAIFSENPMYTDVGEVPLPPYIVAKRKKGGEPLFGGEHLLELEAYNTIYSKELGSVASPTAGRHFTAEILSKMKEKGIDWHEITLHVGLGTFKPVSSADIRGHEMHAEKTIMSKQVADAVNQAKAVGKKIVAVGTTSARALEGFADERNLLVPGTRDINIFIHPDSGHRWKIVDALLTNFHLPESTLLMMVADFLGSRAWALELYQEAIKQKYRFYSYGDAMLILE